MAKKIITTSNKKIISHNEAVKKNEKNYYDQSQ